MWVLGKLGNEEWSEDVPPVDLRAVCFVRAIADAKVECLSVARATTEVCARKSAWDVKCTEGPRAKLLYDATDTRRAGNLERKYARTCTR